MRSAAHSLAACCLCLIAILACGPGPEDPDGSNAAPVAAAVYPCPENQVQVGDNPNAAPTCRAVQPADLTGIPNCNSPWQHLGYNLAARDFECINSESWWQGVTFLRQDVTAGALSTAWIHAFDVTS